MKPSILVIEDEQHIARVLSLELSHEGFAVDCAFNGLSGVEMAAAGKYDLILLDLMLPGLSGEEVLKRIRETNETIPVIMLTARGSTSDKVSGFAMGANDYVTKPFATEELLARIRNLLRLVQRKAETADTYRVADLLIEVSPRRVVRNDKTIDLTPREFDLLLYLVQNAGRVLTREQIIGDVWGYEFVGDTNVVDVYIRYLRKKVDKNHKPKLIQTQHGVGYYMRDIKP